MTENLPKTLAHIENFPLLTMSGEELLHNQQRFEANLQNADMSLNSLVRTFNPRNQGQYELGLAYIELDVYASGISTLDEMLVICPLHFESCLALLKVFHQFKRVELFNKEADYAAWVLTHTQDTGSVAQYCRDWSAIVTMGLELDEHNFRNKFVPLLGVSTRIPNNLAAFYTGINERISDAMRCQSVNNRAGAATSESTYALTHERAGSVRQIQQSAPDKSVECNAARGPKYFNLLRQRKKTIRAVGESWEAEQGIQLVMICDRERFEKRKQSERDKENSAQLEGLAGLATSKELRPIGHSVFAEIERIGCEQPNFSQVTGQILTALHAQCLSGMAATLPPMLLYGAPGVGKTRYVKRIAAALGLPYCDIPLAGNPDAFKITGLSRYWGNAGPGMIATTLANSPVANPIFVLDEIDKVKRSENGDPLARILLLLEQETAASFKDDFVDVPFNAAFASHLATANSIDELPEPLLNRFICVEIEPLDRQGRGTLVHTVYRELRTQQKYGAFFSADIPHATLTALAECEALNGRELKRELQQAMQRACRSIPLGHKPDQTLELTVDCLHLPEIKQSRSMGFMR